MDGNAVELQRKTSLVKAHVSTNSNVESPIKLKNQHDRSLLLEDEPDRLQSLENAQSCNERVSAWSMNKSVDVTVTLNTPRTRRFIARLSSASENLPTSSYPISPIAIAEYNKSPVNLSTLEGDGQLAISQEHSYNDQRYLATECGLPLSSIYNSSRRYPLRNTAKRREYHNTRHENALSDSTGSEATIKAKRRKLSHYNTTIIPTATGWDTVATNTIDEDASDSFQPTKSSSPIHKISLEDMMPVTIGKPGRVPTRQRRPRPSSITDKLSRLVHETDTNLDLSYHSVLPHYEESQSGSTDTTDGLYRCTDEPSGDEMAVNNSLQKGHSYIESEQDPFFMQKETDNIHPIESGGEETVKSVDIRLHQQEQSQLACKIAPVHSDNHAQSLLPSEMTTDGTFDRIRDSHEDMEMDIEEQTSQNSECVSESLPSAQSSETSTIPKSYTARIIEKLSRLILGS
ncbi:hypothetical protein EC973_004689 [Apophysomyces ossiformis]|uniref:Uncharacterized protein n=1 Tax=Apophysomyces ossiformis TaxID=679940 RepID=A0A8H7BHZ7_9FUNG|nr:hypothetical protein EC973_004689 [Apophysomyces ossiformis]